MINGKSQFFLKYENEFPIGFAQCQLRYDYVEGTSTSPVGYLEGIFVKESYRSKCQRIINRVRSMGERKRLSRVCQRL